MDKNEALNKLNELLGFNQDPDVFTAMINSIKEKANFENNAKLQDLAAKMTEMQSKLTESHNGFVDGFNELAKFMKDNKIELPETFDVTIKNPTTEVSVKNFRELKIPAPLEGVSIKNIKEFPNYKDAFEGLAKLINRLVVKAESNKAAAIDLDKYLDPKRPLAVRLSDGQRFYTAIATGGGGGGGGGLTLFDLNIRRALANVAASQTDSNIVTAVSGKQIRVISATMQTGGTATDLTFNSKGGGGGTAISMVFQNASNGGEVLPANENGWFETNVGEGLTVTTGAGSTTGVQLNYILV